MHINPGPGHYLSIKRTNQHLEINSNRFWNYEWWPWQPVACGWTGDARVTLFDFGAGEDETNAACEIRHQNGHVHGSLFSTGQSIIKFITIQSIQSSYAVVLA